MQKKQKMYIYNITLSVEEQNELEFSQFLKSIIIPFIKNENVVDKTIVLKLLTEVDNGAINFALQNEFDQVEKFFEFETSFLPKLFSKIDLSYSGKYLYFSTLLEEI